MLKQIIQALLAMASIPTADKPPSNLASMIKQCEAKGRKDLGQKILAQWAKVLEKYPDTRVNWAAASAVGGNSIKKNVFGGQEFVDWLAQELDTPASELKAIPAVEIPAGTPSIAVPKKDESPEDWKAAAAETEATLKEAHKAFASTGEFVNYLETQIEDLQRKMAEYGPGGKKHLLKSGEPHSYAKRVPKWEAQLKVYATKLEAVKKGVVAAESKFTKAAEAYAVAPVTTVEYESKVQDSLVDVLSFILDIEDLKKQKELLDKFNDNLKKMETKTAASVEVLAEGLLEGLWDKVEVLAEGLLEGLWDKVVGFWEKILTWARGLLSAVDSFSQLAHMESEPAAEASLIRESMELVEGKPNPESEKEDFIDFLESTLIPDLEDSGAVETAKDFQTLIKFLQGETQADGYTLSAFKSYLKQTLVPDLKEMGMSSTAKDFEEGLGYLKKKAAASFTDYQKDLALTLLTIEFSSVLDDKRDEHPELTREFFVPQSEMTEQLESVAQSHGVKLEKFLPLELESKIESKANAAWDGKLTVEELYEHNARAAHHLMLEALGHGVSPSDEPEIAKWLESKGIDQDLHLNMDGAYNEAQDLLDALTKQEVTGSKLSPKAVPKDYPVQPLKPGQQAKDPVTCGSCGLTWDDGISTSMTPVPSGRCPFESFHKN